MLRLKRCKQIQRDWNDDRTIFFDVNLGEALAIFSMKGMAKLSPGPRKATSRPKRNTTPPFVLFENFDYDQASSQNDDQKNANRASNLFPQTFPITIDRDALRLIPAWAVADEAVRSFWL